MILADAERARRISEAGFTVSVVVLPTEAGPGGALAPLLDGVGEVQIPVSAEPLAKLGTGKIDRNSLRERYRAFLIDGITA